MFVDVFINVTMKIFSSKLLSWPQVLHLYQAGRLYPGQWQNYYFYQVLIRKPLSIYTHCPLSLLQENRPYFCYNKFHRDKGLEWQNNEFMSVNNYGVQNTIFYPATIENDDILVVYDESLKGYPHTTFDNYYDVNLV